MYIAENYWGEYIGGTDDSLTLTAYLAGKGKQEITAGEVFADFGLDKLGGDFRRPEEPLAYEDGEGHEMALCYAIDLITDLAALVLECRVSSNVRLAELDDTLDGAALAEPVVTVTAAGEDRRLIERTLADFASAPEQYDLSEMMGEKELREMAAVCGRLREELCR